MEVQEDRRRSVGRHVHVEAQVAGGRERGRGGGRTAAEQQLQQQIVGGHADGQQKVHYHLPGHRHSGRRQRFRRSGRRRQPDDNERRRRRRRIVHRAAQDDLRRPQGTAPEQAVVVVEFRRRGLRVVHRGGRPSEGRADRGLVVRRRTPAGAGQPVAQDTADQAVRPVRGVGRRGRLRSAENDERVSDAAAAPAAAARRQNGHR